jgi:S-adenosyl-methyltransferase MraW
MPLLTKRLITVHNNFRFVENFIQFLKLDKIDGILADLGVSSHQFDTGERGFSFRFDAPLDMRMNRKEGVNAAEIINTYPQDEIVRILKEWGEIDNPRKVADIICKQRNKQEILTTGDLEKSVSCLFNAQTKHKFLAKLFQALRIEVNHEMSALSDFLSGCKTILKSGGRLSVITYHSLEDRMVKNYIKTGNCNGEVSKDFYGKIETPFSIITRKPILPSNKEQEENSRSRSAKLRIAEKI